MADLPKGDPLSGGYRQDYSARDFAPMLSVYGEGKAFSGGYIVTPHGIVGFYRQPGPRQPYTTLSVVFAGRCHDVSWNREFTDRRLKTLAKRFAKAVASGGAAAPLLNADESSREANQ